MLLLMLTVLGDGDGVIVDDAAINGAAAVAAEEINMIENHISNSPLLLLLDAQGVLSSTISCGCNKCKRGAIVYVCVCAGGGSGR